MAKNHTVRFCVSKQQLEDIRREADANGYVTISSYLRDLALQRKKFIELKIIETHQIVKNIMEKMQ